MKTRGRENSQDANQHEPEGAGIATTGQQVYGDLEGGSRGTRIAAMKEEFPKRNLV
jgi:hypothetical protein